MRGALLFLLTVMLVTPGGRENIADFVGQTAEFYDAGAPYTAMMLSLTAGMALVILLMLRRRKPEKRHLIIIRSEVSAPPADAQPRRKKARFGWLRTIRPFFKRLSWA
jgi:hypothetical protein